MKLRTYQEGVVSELLSNIEQCEKILLDSPTGSGKTYMLVSFMKEYLQLNRNTVFIWVSARPSLVSQSRESANRLGLETYSIEDINLKTDGFDKGDSLFVNWERIKSPTNNARIQLDNSVTFDEVMENTRNRGLDIIVINDESHFGSDTLLVNELLETIIKPSKKIDISATPSHSEYDHIIKVSKEVVRKEEMIKKGFFINKDLLDYNSAIRSKYDLLYIKPFTLYNALLKHEELIKLHKKVGKGVKPILLVQLPNYDEDHTHIMRLLVQKGYSLSNGKVAIYTHEYSTHQLDELARNEQIEIIMFKQALSTGWDCPRSHTIAILREVHKMDFFVQTLGRLTRNVYQKYFTGELEPLNYAYVYVANNNSEKIQKLEKVVVSEGFGMLEKRDTLTKFDYLLKSDWSKDNLSLLDRIKLETKYNKFCELNLPTYEIPTSVQRQHLGTDYIIESGQFTEIQNMVQLTDLSEMDIYSMVSSYFNRQANRKYAQLFIDGLLVHFKQLNYSHKDSLKIIYENANELYNLSAKFIFEELVGVHKKSPVLTEWTPPKHLISTKNNYKEETEPSNCLYKNYKVNGSDVEKSFMLQLLGSSNVKYWYKNGDKGQEHFSLFYVFENLFKKHYPDFLIETKEGKVLIIETKSDFMDKSTLYKFIFAQRYIKLLKKQVPDLDVEYKLVKIDKGRCLEYISTNPSYKSLLTHGDWKPFQL